jgi:hypothetical protein
MRSLRLNQFSPVTSSFCPQMTQISADSICVDLRNLRIKLPMLFVPALRAAGLVVAPQAFIDEEKRLSVTD